ncbi:MAG: NERD domain-containing protein [Pseudomonadota bacterium]
MLRFLLNFAVRTAIHAAKDSYNTPERKGARGERRVRNALTSALDEKEYRVLSDLILPVAVGTTQLDHIVLSRFGLFVIETKNMSGWIFGGADQNKWTQVQKGGKRRGFQNPLRQNYAHIKAVQEILSVDESVLHNIVVFVGTAEPKTAMPENVAWGLRELGRLIAVRKQQLLTDAQVNDCVRMLQVSARKNTRATRNEHLHNLQNKAVAKKTSSPPKRLVAADTASCPRCGSEMVKRANRKTGEAFWGCAKFPKCRGTRRSA